METINCIVCGIDRTNLLLVKNGYRVVRCKECGLVYLNPRPRPEELEAFYNRPERNLLSQECCKRLNRGHEDHKRRKFSLALNMLRRYKSNLGKVFDLGCSTGVFLEMVRQKGGQPFGSDLNGSLIEALYPRFGSNVMVQEGTTIEAADGLFDVVTLFDVIEHLPDPTKSMLEVSRVLADDGILVVSTPNINGLFPKITYLLFGKAIGAWDHPEPPGHLFQFSEHTLTKVFDCAGFKPVAFTDFYMYPPYTVGELTNTIVDSLKNRFRKQRHTRTSKQAKKAITDNGNDINRSIALARIPRMIVHRLCQILVFYLYPIGRFLKRGDSMIVLAKKVNNGKPL